MALIRKYFISLTNCTSVTLSERANNNTERKYGMFYWNWKTHEWMNEADIKTWLTEAWRVGTVETIAVLTDVAFARTEDWTVFAVLCTRCTTQSQTAVVSPPMFKETACDFNNNRRTAGFDSPGWPNDVTSHVYISSFASRLPWQLYKWQTVLCLVMSRSSATVLLYSLLFLCTIFFLSTQSEEAYSRKMYL